ncbi:MAG: methyltransferase domain-containing protein [Candidatus Sulfomarinibacteraceae bacterium]
MKTLFDLTPWGLKRRNRILAEDLARLTERTDRRLDVLEEALRTVQTELAELRDAHVTAAEQRLDDVEGAVAAVAGETTRLRDGVVPAMVGRSDVLLERFAAEVDELGSLVERMLRREPLPVPGESALDESKLAAALAAVQPALLEAFRGPEAEIRHRLDRYLEALRANAPVVDLGCGRGELLLMLREAGVAAIGVEGDAAVAQASRRRGLEVVEADVLEGLRAFDDGSRGAVTAIHLFEHLEPSALLAVLAEVRRVLRPGGVLIVESPNPHSLRVGAALYWADPTHRRPLLPETLELYVKTAGLEVDRCELIHPFPDDQLFADEAEAANPGADPALAALEARIGRLSRRLDELVNGPRDFVLWARKPNTTTT